MAEITGSLQGIVAVKVTDSTTNNPYTVWVESNTGKVVSISNSSLLSETASQRLGTDITLSRSEAAKFLNDNKTEINKSFKSLNYKEYTTAENALASQTRYDQQSTRIDKYLANYDAASFEFQKNNEANLSKLTKKAPDTTGEVIVFPSDLLVQSSNGGVEYSQDTIRIRALKYVPPQKGLLEGKRNTDIYSKGIVSNNQIFGGFNNYDYRGEVILPMPLSVRDAVGAEWGISAMNTLALGLFGAVRDKYEGTMASVIRAGIPILKGPEAYLPLLEAFGNAGGANSALAQQIINNVTSDILSSGLGIKVDPLQVLARSTGSVVNNNAELLFTGPKLRSFEFAWKLSPRNKDDSQKIINMIRWFKVNSLPYVKNNGAIFMETPNVFIVQYTKANNQRNESLPQPKVCALLDFRVDYTPDGIGWASYGDDSRPITSSIVVQMQELTPLFANEYAGTENTAGY